MFDEEPDRDPHGECRAEIARLTAELAAARAEVDCGQDGPCAQAPGCARHWQERNRELVDELAAARAVPGGVEAAIEATIDHFWFSALEIDDPKAAEGTEGFPGWPDTGCGVARDLRTAIARAISDATAAATESLKNGMRRVFKCSAHNVDPTKAWGCPDCLAELRRATAARETVGGLLATAPVGAIVEFWHGATANQITTRVGGIDGRMWLWRYRNPNGEWSSWDYEAPSPDDLSQPGEIVPARPEPARPAAEGRVSDGPAG